MLKTRTVLVTDLEPGDTFLWNGFIRVVESVEEINDEQIVLRIWGKKAFSFGVLTEKTQVVKRLISTWSWSTVDNMIGE